MEQNFEKAKELIVTISEKTKELNLLLVELRKNGVSSFVEEYYTQVFENESGHTQQVRVRFVLGLGDTK